MKRALLSALLVPGVDLPLRLLMRSRATIFMLHRFQDHDRGVRGTDPATLRQALAWLRRRGYPTLSLADLFRGLSEGSVPSRAVAFTIDDGYLDQATVAAPVFAEFDVPVTTFLTTGFLDRKLWFWWDRIEFAFENTRRTQVAVQVGGREIEYRWTSKQERAESQSDFTERCKRVPDEEKHMAIVRIAEAAEVDLPTPAPARYTPMSWEDARRVERGGMTFGPHTLTHPILTQVSDAEADREIRESWLRLQQELSRPDPVFCYPNGGPADFGVREIKSCRAAGMLGAVVGTPGYIDSHRFRNTSDHPYLVPRFSLPEELPALAQYASGLERLKDLMRGNP